jgi:hypothetical protein
MTSAHRHAQAEAVTQAVDQVLAILGLDPNSNYPGMAKAVGKVADVLHGLYEAGQHAPNQKFARHVASLLGYTNVPPFYAMALGLSKFVAAPTDHRVWDYADECRLCYHKRKALPLAWAFHCRCNQRDAA